MVTFQEKWNHYIDPEQLSKYPFNPSSFSIMYVSRCYIAFPLQVPAVYKAPFHKIIAFPFNFQTPDTCHFFVAMLV